MEILVELFIRNFLTHFVGLNTRYFFFKIFGSSKTKDYFSGEKGNDKVGTLSQNVLNAIVGIIVIVCLSFIGNWYRTE